MSHGRRDPRQCVEGASPAPDRPPFHLRGHPVLCHYPAGVTPSDPGTSGTGRAGAAGAVVRGFPFGRIAGVPITVAPSWVLSVAVIAALGVPLVAQAVPGTGTALAVLVAMLLAIALGVSVLVHELGHCLAARALGMTVVGVRLYLLGGVTELGRVPRTPREEATIAAAGPVVSGLLAGLFAVLARVPEADSLSRLLLVLIALANLAVAVFNLLPALPLDGGRVLRAAVWRAFGSRRAGTTAGAVGGYLIALALAGWAAYLLIDGGTSALLPAGIALAMALFVLVGAWIEQRPRRGSAPGVVTLAGLARQLVELPTETPVAAALDAAARGAVVLTESDGTARGLLDVPAARALAGRDPSAPASLVARPVPPQAVLFAVDDPREVLHRTRSVGATDFLLVDDLGRPAGVISRNDLAAALSAPSPRRWPRRRQQRSGGQQPPAAGQATARRDRST